MDKTKHKQEPNGALAKPKEKRRSNEKRKEKSRDAARCRRSRETEIFTELGQVLPLHREEVEQLDKASIMRLAIAYLKVRDMLNLFPSIDQPSLLPPSENDKIEEIEQKPFDFFDGPESYKYLSAALDGFLLILSGEGDIIFSSENISDYLGISQIDLLGQQIWEYTHQCDHDELKEALNIRRCSLGEDKPKENAVNGSSNIVLTTAHRDLFLRLKCTLTSRGRSVNIKSASYKVIHLTGHLVMNASGERILIGVGRPLPNPSNIEIPLGSATFLTKHSLDMKFTYVDDKMLSLLGYNPTDLMDKSLYDCHHGADSESLMTTFKSVLSKGQGETCRYRFLGKCGGYCWVVTQATIVYDKQKPQSVVCVNYAISELENSNEIYSCAQLEAHHQDKENGDKHNHHEIIVTQPENNNNNTSQTKLKYILSPKLQNVNIPKSNPCLTTKPLNSVDESQEETYFKCIKPTKTTYASASKDNHFNNSNITNNRKRSDDITLSPIRRTLNNCSISVNDKTNETRPKSVTASVFTQVPISTEHISALLQTQPVNGSYQIQQNQQHLAASAKSVTASVFTPISALPTPINRTFLPNTSKRLLPVKLNTNNSINSTSEDMNSRYLIYPDEATALTMPKEEPDDLTHLAPSLDDSTQLFGEMLDSLILPDAYGTLLSDDIHSLDSQNSNCNNSKNSNSHLIDPFINYRDESCDTSSPPHLLSPDSASKSPEVSSIPSLCSPNSLSQDDEFAFMTMNNVTDDIDLTMRAPYIPMNEQDDLPLLTEDLMWSAFTDEFSFQKDSLQMEALKASSNGASSSTCNSIYISNTNSIGTTSASSSTSAVNSNSNKSTNNVDSDNCSMRSNKDTIISSSVNNIISENESSLAALLCSSGGGGGVNSIHKNQSQNHDSNDESDKTRVATNRNECKRRKTVLESNDETENDLMDGIDEFDPTFSKKSSSGDCWTMNDLLEINSISSPSSPATSPHHHIPEKQNIIICTAMPTAKIHVPLNSIQNKTENSKVNCISILENSTSLKSNLINNGTLSDSKNNNTTSNQLKRLSTTVVKGMSINIAPQNINPITNHNLTSSKAITISNPQNNTKRPSNVILSSPEIKRVRNGLMIDTPDSPHLLQQLMAPSPQRIKSSNATFDKIQGRWLTADADIVATGSHVKANAGQLSSKIAVGETQPSSSVLKNLLVSGCDDTTKAIDIRHSTNILIAESMIFKTSADNYNQNGSNPLIGGAGVPPSPPNPIEDEKDDAGGTGTLLGGVLMNSVTVASFSPVGSDSSGSDSGVECGLTPNTLSAPSLMYSVYRTSNQIEDRKDQIEPDITGKVKLPANSSSLANLSNGQDVNKLKSAVSVNESRKMAYPFIGEDNPLCSPFLMDLCNDDYCMVDQLESEILEENEMTKVLSGWGPQNQSS